MPKQFKIGDHVRWNSEAGYITRTIGKIHERSFNCKGYAHRTTKVDPQYEIKCDKTDHLAAHKGEALQKIK